MSKAHRGKGMLDQVKRGRGECPICKRTGIKLVHEKEVDGNKVNICKICNVVTKRKAS